MAGATNRQMKRAGFKSAGIQKIRNGQGGALSIRSAMRVADRVNVPTPAKAILKYGTGSEAPKGWQAAAKGGDRAAAAASATPVKSARPGLASALGAASKGMLASRKNAAAKEVARAVYERGNEGSAARKAAMRTDIREKVRGVRSAESAYKSEYNRVYDAAGKSTPAFRRGKEAARREVVRAVAARDVSVQDAAMRVKQARLGLRSALASRNATAMAGKQRRGAESGGQLDLFSGAPKPRAATPFERRMALRDAQVAKLGKTTAALSKIVREKRVIASKTPLGNRLKEIGQMKRDAAAARAAWSAEARKANPGEGSIERFTPRMNALAKVSDAKRREYEKASKLRSFDEMGKRYWGALSVVRNAQKAASRASSLAAAARAAGDHTKAAQLQKKADSLYKRRDDANLRAKKFDTVGMSYERAERLKE